MIEIIKEISYALDCLSALFLVLIAYLSFIKNGIQRSRHKNVFGIVLCVFGMLIFDAFYIKFFKLSDQASRTAAFCFQELYLLCNTVAIFFWVYYVGRLIWDRNYFGKTYRKIYIAALVINVVLLVVNVFYKVLFYIDESGEFCAVKAGLILFTFLNYLPVIIAFVSIVRNRSRIPSNAFYQMLLFPVPVVIGEILSFPLRDFSMVFAYAISSVLLLNVYDRYSDFSEIDTIIEDAITNNRFELFYQPIYSYRTNSFSSCEALLRVKDEQGAYLDTEAVISAAEKTGKITNIGRFALSSACSFINSPGFDDLGLNTININLSMAEISMDGFADRFINKLTENFIPPSKICVEVTETVITTDDAVIIENMQKLDNVGVVLAIDDFGSGYSNLYRIARFPFSIIKIDKTIVNSDIDSKLDTIARGFIELLNDMNYLTVAEGIETKDQLDRFHEYGCNYMQGYYYSKPLPYNEFISFLKNNKK